MRTCRRCGESKPEDAYYLHTAYGPDGQPYRTYRAGTCKACVCARQRDLHNGQAQSTVQRQTKIAADGRVWCPSCRAYLAATAFRPSRTNRSGYGTWCLACSLVKEKQERAKRFSDPAAWDRKLAHNRAWWQERRRVEERERKSFVRLGLRTLRSKGLNDRALKTILGVTEHSLYLWRCGSRMPSIAGEERIALALKCTMDLPVVADPAGRVRSDPVLTALVKARVDCDRHTLRPIRSRWRNREQAA